ncbi:serine hydrolase [Paenibacillus azoreducens]|uniref:serine hydrolase n=1 Tax=Paenibacillus azoreducens TaxID=116718 RepID=UPI0039F44932
MKKIKMRTWAASGMALLLALDLTGGSKAAAMAANTSATSGMLDSSGLEKLIDQFMQERIGTEEGAPGAVVAVVQDGRMVLKKGYGFADREKKLPADPDHTLFRIGSVTKTFTAAAIMRLVDEGKIDLHADVQKYMGGIRFTNPFKTPVTVHHLLTHTSGFQVTTETLDDMPEDLGTFIPLKKYIEQKKPAIVREPGTSYMYDNYAFNLLGYIIENVSGMPYQQYMEQNMLKPLGMKASEMVISNQMLSHLATGYDDSNKPITPYGFSPTEAPDGGMLTTAEDAAHFMIAQLNRGTYSGNRLWKDATVKQMQRYHSSIHPDSPDSGYGYENMLGTGKINGLEITGKGGDVPGYSSFILLIPEKKIGVFMAFNKLLSSPYVARDWNQVFMDAYFPASNGSVGPKTYLHTPQQQLKRFEGIYSDLRARMLITKVSATGNGELTVEDDIEGVHKLKQIDPLLFEDEKGGMLAFKEEQDGTISYLKYGNPVSYAVKPRGTFADVRLDSEYAPFIAQMHAMGFIKGTDGRYDPAKPLTRADLAAIIVRMMGSNLSSVPSRFEDVKGTWAEREVETAAAAGWMQGMTDRKFEPNRELTREEAASILIPLFQSAAFEAMSKFQPDKIKLADVAKPASVDIVKLLIAAGLTGPDANIQPDGTVQFRAVQPIKREEVAVWVVRFVQRIVLGKQ